VRRRRVVLAGTMAGLPYLGGGGPEPKPASPPAPAGAQRPEHPHDRFGHAARRPPERHAGYHRDLTPNLERLAQRATVFTDCYVPCARTAPSIVSMLTGTWPHTHGVRDTFVTPEQTRCRSRAAEDPARAGYSTAIVGDWAGLGRREVRLRLRPLRPARRDQWNIKYLLRQGPKDLRLFLSLFTQGRFGKRLPAGGLLPGGHSADRGGRAATRGA
jgi:hypothetical protein